MKSPVQLTFLQNSFATHANAQDAVQMKKYMKDLFDFYGIKSPVRKEIYKAHKNEIAKIPDEKNEEIARWCWLQEQREWQYFAMEFLGKRSRKIDSSVISLYEHLIVTKSWWDTVDFIAVNLIGNYFQKYPERIIDVTGEWMSSGNMWLQRSCILFQLKYKKNTDIALLENFIDQLKGSQEFFIRKAIGWCLREYSKTNPDYVIDFVKNNTLSGLSHREALKWMANKGIL